MDFGALDSVPPPTTWITDPDPGTGTSPPPSGWVPWNLNPFWIVGIVLGILGFFIFLWALNRWLAGREESATDTEKPTLEELFSLGWALNTYLGYNLVLMFIGTIIGMIGAIRAFMGFAFEGLVIIVMTAMSILTLRMYFERRSRGKSTKKYLTGNVVTKDGRKISYCMKDIRRESDYIVTKTTKEQILSDGRITEENIDKLFRTRCSLGNGHEIIILSRTPYSEAFEWVEGGDLDIHGEFETEESAPELREVALLTTSEPSPWEVEKFVTRYLFVFLAVWDDASSRKFNGALDHIDVETNDILASLLVVMGAERHVTTGELNAAKGELLFLKRDGKNIDVTVHALANAKAEEYVEDMRKLSALDSAKEYARVDYILIILALLIVGFGAYQWGYSNAMNQFINVGMIGSFGLFQRLFRRGG